MAPYTDVEWTGGGVDSAGDETKLNQMADTIDYLRPISGNRRTLSSAMGASEGVDFSTVGIDASTDFRLRVSSGAVTVLSDAYDADGADHALTGLDSIDVTSLSSLTFPHQVDLLVDVKRTPAGVWATYGTLGRFWFIRSPEDDRLSVTGTLRATRDAGWYSGNEGLSQNNRLHVQAFGLKVGAHRSGTGDARYVDVTFDGPSPGPAELVSDTDMNQLTTNQTVIRDRLSCHHLGGSPVHGIGNESLFEKGTLQSTYYKVRLQFFVDGVLVGTDETSPGTIDSYTTRGIANRSMPLSPSWGLSTCELRYQVANGASQTWVGTNGPGTDGWLLARSRWWRSPDDLFFHGACAIRAWFGRDRWLRPWFSDPFVDAFTVKTAGVSFMASRVGLAAT